MQESIHKYFHVGLISFMAYPSMLRGEDPGAPEVIKKIACDDYFDAVEVTWIKDGDKRAEIKKYWTVPICGCAMGPSPGCSQRG